MISRVIIGVDEAGRGCLAGPVYAAAVVLPDVEMPWFSEIKDSKKLSPKKREKLVHLIESNCKYAVRESYSYVIDDMNILYASLYAMSRAVSSIYAQFGSSLTSAVVLVDGNKTIPTIHEGGPDWLDVPWEQLAIPGGDNLDKSIAAASILAKVHRDRYMVFSADKKYPEYGFAIHKGYGTKSHREAIKMFGVSPIHRKTFNGVRQYV